MSFSSYWFLICQMSFSPKKFWKYAETQTNTKLRFFQKSLEKKNLLINRVFLFSATLNVHSTTFVWFLLVTLQTARCIIATFKINSFYQRLDKKQIKTKVNIGSDTFTNLYYDTVTLLLLEYDFLMLNWSAVWLAHLMGADMSPSSHHCLGGLMYMHHSSQL